METRLTLRPGQPGTRKLVEKYGERLVCVRYVYDAGAGRRQPQKPWEITFRDSKRLGIEDRIVEGR